VNSEVTVNVRINECLKRGMPVLRMMLERTEEDGVLERAVNTLGLMSGDVEALKLLMQTAINDDISENVRYIAKGTLRNSARRSPETAIGFLLPLLKVTAGSIGVTYRKEVRCCNLAVEIICQLAASGKLGDKKQEVEEALILLTNEADTELRLSSLTALAQIRPSTEEAAKVFIDRAIIGSTEERLAAIEGLSRFEGEVDTTSLYYMLEDSEVDNKVKIAILRALGEIGEANTIRAETLCKIITEERDAELSNMAVFALGTVARVNDSNSSSLLESMLKSNKPDISDNAAYSLAILASRGNDAVLADLIQIVKSSSYSIWIRRKVAYGLGKAFVKTQNHRLKNLLSLVISPVFFNNAITNIDIMMYAFEGIGEALEEGMGGDEVIIGFLHENLGVLKEMIFQTDSEEVSKVAINILGLMPAGRQELGILLHTASQHECEMVRSLAKEMVSDLANRSPEVAIDFLLPILCWEPLRSLVQSNKKIAIEVIRQLAASGKLGDKKQEVEETLIISLTNETNTELRLSLLIALAEIRPNTEEAAGILIDEATRGGSTTERLFAISGLSRFEGEVDITSLYRVLEDNKVDNRVKVAILQVLGEKGEVNATGAEILSEIMESSPEMVSMAGFALGSVLEINDKLAERLLTLIELSSVESIRGVAYGFVILASRGDVKSQECLKHYIDDSEGYKDKAMLVAYEIGRAFVKIQPNEFLEYMLDKIISVEQDISVIRSAFAGIKSAMEELQLLENP